MLENEIANSHLLGHLAFKKGKNKFGMLETNLFKGKQASVFTICSRKMLKTNISEKVEHPNMK